jgi:hypothetical protein
MAYTRKSIVKKGSGAGAPKNPNVTIIAVDDIQTFPPRDGGNVNIVGNFVLKPGAKAYEVYMTPSEIKANVESDGSEDSQSFKPMFEGPHPGNDLEISEFVQNWTGVNVVIIYGSCSDGYKKVMGTPCAPLQLKASAQDDNDKRNYQLKFEAYAKTQLLPGHYTGSTNFNTTTTVASVTAVAVTSANGNVYQLPALETTAAIAFSEIGLAHGDVITLVGGGGANPATLANGVTDKKAMLVNGTTWVGLLNATISLKVFNNGGITLLQEISRT